MLLGDNLSVGQGLYITIFSMSIVFATLFLISIILSNFGKVFKDDNKEQNTQKMKIEKTPVVEKNIENNNEDEELVAIITAAIAMNLSKSTSDIKIRSIRKITQNQSSWVMSGRQDSYANWQSIRVNN